MRYALYVIAAFVALNAVATISAIGKERKPTTQGVAITVLIIDAAIAVILILAAARLP